MSNGGILAILLAKFGLTCGYPTHFAEFFFLARSIPLHLAHFRVNCYPMEKLNQYLMKHGLTRAAFGQLIELDQSSVSRILNGKQSPSLRHLGLILVATHGEITPNDMIDPKFWRAVKKR